MERQEAVRAGSPPLSMRFRCLGCPKYSPATHASASTTRPRASMGIAMRNRRQGCKTSIVPGRNGRQSLPQHNSKIRSPNLLKYATKSWLGLQEVKFTVSFPGCAAEKDLLAVSTLYEPR